MNNNDFQAHAQKIEQVIERVNSLSDPDARALALELLQSLMELHGDVLARIGELMEEAGEPGRTLWATLGRDPLVCGLLVLYGVHPIDLETRVRQALERVQPRLKKQGGEAELIVASEAAVRVRIHGAGQGRASAPHALQKIVEQAILEAAPEVVEILVEGVAPPASAFIPLNMIQPAAKEEGTYEKSTT